MSGAFASIESAEAYVASLLEAVEATAAEVGEDLRGVPAAEVRQRDALRLAAFKLEQLRSHLATSRRRLGELLTLRRMLHGEDAARRAFAAEAEPAAA